MDTPTFKSPPASDLDSLPRRVIGAGMKVHRALGCGFLESVYRKALAIELTRLGISFELHPVLSVFFEGHEVGTFQADLIIDQKLIVELKAVETLAPVHSLQLINYLAAAGLEEGLLLTSARRVSSFARNPETRPPAPKSRPNSFPDPPAFGNLVI